MRISLGVHSIRFASLSFVALGVLTATACSAGHSATARGPVVRITERDFHIVAPKRIAAGDVRLLVRNKGPDTHELLVVRTRGSRLPLRADGLTVDEEALHPAGSLDGGGPGKPRELDLHLAPGRYELFCNMYGHYLGGMHTVLVVT